MDPTVPALIYEIEVELAGLPPSPNRTRESQHWAARAEIDKRWRNDSRLLTLAAIRRAPRELQAQLPWATCSLGATFYLPDRRRRDPGNLVGSEGFKALVDGLVDAQLIVDDSLSVILVYGPFSFALRPRAPGVKVSVRSWGN